MGLNKYKMDKWEQKQKKNFSAWKFTTSQQYRTLAAMADGQEKTDNLQ
jgi:hypothetical protein